MSKHHKAKSKPSKPVKSSGSEGQGISRLKKESAHAYERKDKNYERHDSNYQRHDQSTW
jgi:hypothetical protein